MGTMLGALLKGWSADGTIEEWLAAKLRVGSPSSQHVVFSEDDFMSLPQHGTGHLPNATSPAEQFGHRYWAGCAFRDWVSCDTLAMFLHVQVAPPTSGGKLIPFQADVNGKRFTSMLSDRTQTRNCNVVAVPYMIGRNAPGSNSGQQEDEDVCRVRPMTYEDSIACATGKEIDEVVGYAEQITDKEISKTFQILFGWDPLSDESNDSPMGSALFMLLLRCIEESFVVGTLGGCKKLLMAIGKHQWPGSDVVEMLNKLKIPDDAIFDVTLAIFSAVIPLKLGFLSGESFVLTAHKNLRGRKENDHPVFKSSATLMEPRGDEFKHVEMKKASNEHSTSGRQDYVPGSIMDFILEATVENIAVPAADPSNQDSDNKSYYEDLKSSIGRAIERIIQASKHNPDIRALKEAYERKRAEANGCPVTLAECSEHVGKTFLSRSINPNLLSTSKSEGPVNLFVLIMLLTDFADRKGAKILAKFLQSDRGKSFLPSGIGGAMDFSSYRSNWNKFKSIQTQMAAKMMDFYKANNDVQVRSKRMQIHRLARRLSKGLLAMIMEQGFNEADDWMSRDNFREGFPNLSNRLTADGVPLQTGLVSMLEVVDYNHHHQADGDIPKVRYGDAFQHGVGKSPPQSALYLMDLKAFVYRGRCFNPFRLAGLFLDPGDKYDDLRGMVDQALPRIKEAKKQERERKKSQKNGEDDSSNDGGNAEETQKDSPGRKGSPFVDDEALVENPNHRQSDVIVHEAEAETDHAVDDPNHRESNDGFPLSASGTDQDSVHVATGSKVLSERDGSEGFQSVGKSHIMGAAGGSDAGVETPSGHTLGKLLEDVGCNQTMITAMQRLSTDEIPPDSFELFRNCVRIFKAISERQEVNSKQLAAQISRLKDGKSKQDQYITKLREENKKLTERERVPGGEEFLESKITNMEHRLRLEENGHRETTILLNLKREEIAKLDRERNLLKRKWEASKSAVESCKTCSAKDIFTGKGKKRRVQ